MNYKLISFYADVDGSTFYSDSAKKMIEACQRLDIDHHIVELESQKDYFKNTLLKPQYILDCLEKFDMPLLWVDVDSIIHKKPILTEKLSLPHINGVVRRNSTAFNIDMFVSPLYFNNTPIVYDLLNDWIIDCKNDKINYSGDHCPFLYNLHYYNIEIEHFLPESWCYNKEFLITPNENFKKVKPEDIIIETVLAPRIQIKSKDYAKVKRIHGAADSTMDIILFKNDKQAIKKVEQHRRNQNRKLTKMEIRQLQKRRAVKSKVNSQYRGRI